MDTLEDIGLSLEKNNFEKKFTQATNHSIQWDKQKLSFIISTDFLFVRKPKTYMQFVNLRFVSANFKGVDF